MNQQLLFWFVLGACYLNLKMLANSFVQGYGRFRYKSFKYKEDQPFFRAEAPSGGEQPEILTRADACWRNDLENIPGFLVAALCGLFCEVPLEVYRALMIIFCAGRTLQTVSLLLAKQPWRFIGFLAGQVATIAMFAWSIRAIL
ncbi:MAG: MAPEG family protein [Vulcanimicrobiota bacterium]